MRSFLFCLIFSTLLLFSIFPEENEYLDISLKIFPENYYLYRDNKIYEPLSSKGNIRVYHLPADLDYFFIRTSGYRDKLVNISAVKDMSEPIELKLERIETELLFSDYISTGSQPKSVEFSPDGKYMAVALLNGQGVEIYSTEDMAVYRKLYLPEKWSQKKGFVETVFFTTRDELWVSQMTTGMIHVFDTRRWAYKLSFDCGGSWPKVIALTGDENRAFISNWESRDISVIDTYSYKLLSRIGVNGIPRGLVVSGDQRYLYVANFTSGDLNKIDISQNRVVKNIDLGNGALRHLVLSDDQKYLYVSDMYHGSVFVINSETDRVVNSFYAGSNINTIKILHGSGKLFISSRGRNSKNGYLQKGPVFGKVFVYDTGSGEISDWIWGGNQPTGLAVSSFGNILVFTDFLDHRLEIYNILN